MTEVGMDIDDSAHQPCYVFQPSTASTHEIDDRPRKKRKSAKEDTGATIFSWPRLCNGVESLSSVAQRRDSFQRLWTEEQKRLDKISNQVDLEVADQVIRYLSTTEVPPGRLQTAVVVSGSNSDVQKRLFRHLASQQANAPEKVFVRLQPNQASNLQTTLRTIIRTTIETYANTEEYLSFLATNKRLIPMNFDLELLQMFTKRHNLGNVVISILDVELFNIGVLSDLLSTLSSWTDRIPFVLLLGVASTVELFESRLSKATVRTLKAEIFELVSDKDELLEAFNAVQNDADTRLFIGPSTLSILCEVTQDQGESVDGLAKSLQQVYMSHFFANPLSVLLSETDFEKADLETLCRAIRNTKSFQIQCETLLRKGKSQQETIRSLLDDDELLFQTALAAVREGQVQVRGTVQALQTFKTLHALLNLSHVSNLDFEVQLYQALSLFVSSDLCDALLSDIEKLHSHELHDLLSHNFPGLDLYAADRADHQSLSQIFTSLEQLHTKYKTSSIQPINSTNTSTAIPLPKTTPKPKTTAAAEGTYTTVLNSFVTLLADYFATSIINPTTLFLHEAFIFNLKSPLSSIITPRPRYSLERALASPGDYLACECCTSSSSQSQHGSSNGAAAAAAGPGRTRLASLPPTSILYQLLSEAGTVINVRDLWDAFRNILIPVTFDSESESESDSDADAEQQNDNTNKTQQSKKQKTKHRGGEKKEEQEAGARETDDDNNENKTGIDDRLALTLFYRALAELKSFGLVKPSKKKPGVDCIAKTNWRGL